MHKAEGFTFTLSELRINGTVLTISEPFNPLVRFASQIAFGMVDEETLTTFIESRSDLKDNKTKVNVSIARKISREQTRVYYGVKKLAVDMFFKHCATAEPCEK